MLANVKLFRRENPYRMFWMGLTSLLVCLAIGYAIGPEAASFLFDVWVLATVLPVNIIPSRYGDHREPGAIPALITWIAWFAVVLVLGFMVFGDPCPSFDFV